MYVLTWKGAFEKGMWIMKVGVLQA